MIVLNGGIITLTAHVRMCVFQSTEVDFLPIPLPIDRIARIKVLLFKVISKCAQCAILSWTTGEALSCIVIKCSGFFKERVVKVFDSLV